MPRIPLEQTYRSVIDHSTFFLRSLFRLLLRRFALIPLRSTRNRESPRGRLISIYPRYLRNEQRLDGFPGKNFSRLIESARNPDNPDSPKIARAYRTDGKQWKLMICMRKIAATCRVNFDQIPLFFSAPLSLVSICNDRYGRIYETPWKIRSVDRALANY